MIPTSRKKQVLKVSYLLKSDQLTFYTVLRFICVTCLNLNGSRWDILPFFRSCVPCITVLVNDGKEERYLCSYTKQVMHLPAVVSQACLVPVIECWDWHAWSLLDSLLWDLMFSWCWLWKWEV